MAFCLYRQPIFAVLLGATFGPTISLAADNKTSDVRPSWTRGMLIDFSQTCPLHYAGFDLVKVERHATNKLCLYGISTTKKI